MTVTWIALSLFLGIFTSQTQSFCTEDAGFEHVSPILCPVAKTRLCWNITQPGTEMVMTVEAKISGWVSVGILDKSGIGPVDMLTMYIDENGDPHAVDQHYESYASGQHTPLLTDAQQDVEILSAEEKTFDDSTSDGHTPGTYSSFTVKRKLNTGDLNQEDFVIVSGQEQGIIWFTSKVRKPYKEGNETIYPSYWYPNGNKGTWKVTFDNSQSTLTCDYYCALQMNACGDAEEKESQYPSENDCKARCTKYLETGTWVLGDLQKDHANNSLACRINAAHQAENVPREDDSLRQTLCSNSGTSGNAVCGTPCENYCSYVTRSCSSLYSSEESCKQECEAGFVREDSNSSCSNPSAVVTDDRFNTANFPFYDTPLCRSVHASLAYDFSGDGLSSFVGFGEDYRCPLASSESSACCNSSVPTCEYYCERIMMSCTGPRAQYPSVQSCKQMCSAQLSGGSLAVGLHTDSSGFTLGCLTFVAAHATSDAMCDAAKIGGSLCKDANMQDSSNDTAPTTPSGPPSSESTTIELADCAPCTNHWMKVIVGGACSCVEVINATMTFQNLSIDDFDVEHFRNNISIAIGVAADRIEVLSVKSGSVIIQFVVKPEPGEKTMNVNEILRIESALNKGSLGGFGTYTLSDFSGPTEDVQTPNNLQREELPMFQLKEESSAKVDVGILIGVIAGVVCLLLLGTFAFFRGRRQLVMCKPPSQGTPDELLDYGKQYKVYSNNNL